MSRKLPAALAIVVALAMSACSTTDKTSEPAYVQVTAATLSPGAPVPAPSGPVVLTMLGELQVSNVGDTLQFDMATLESLGLVEYSVDDVQAEGRRVSFRGVLVSDLLAVAGAQADASNLHTVALNDYAVDIPTGDVMQWPVIVATQVDGERMTVDRYGPTRIVYPYDSFDIDSTIHDPRWNWQLTSIEVQ